MARAYDGHLIGNRSAAASTAQTLVLPPLSTVPVRRRPARRWPRWLVRGCAPARRRARATCCWAGLPMTPRRLTPTEQVVAVKRVARGEVRPDSEAIVRSLVSGVVTSLSVERWRDGAGEPGDRTGTGTRWIDPGRHRAVAGDDHEPAGPQRRQRDGRIHHRRHRRRQPSAGRDGRRRRVPGREIRPGQESHRHR